jgi:hypothetical protein
MVRVNHFITNVEIQVVTTHSWHPGRSGLVGKIRKSVLLKDATPKMGVKQGRPYHRFPPASSRLRN